MEVYLELMATIQELPKLDRPREKGIRYGVNTLSDSELIAIIIGKGYHGENAREVANNMLETSNGLIGLSKLSYGDFIKLKGIKEAKALLFSTIFELYNRLLIKELEEIEDEVDSDYLYRKYRSIFSKENQENLALVTVDRKNHITFEKIIYKGTENNVIFSYKEIWRELILHKAYMFYLIHNHPSNEAKPSLKDRVFTEELFKESNRIKIPLKDHIIIGDDGYYSFDKNKKISVSC